MKAAIPRIPDAVGRLDREKTLAFDRQIERIAGLLQLTLGQVQLVPAKQSIVVHSPS
jgi:hypothetical protein